MIIPISTLQNELLDSLLEEIVTRDGTDYGVVELTTEQKVERAKAALKTGQSKLYWDEETESASLITKELADKLEKQIKS